MANFEIKEANKKILKCYHVKFKYDLATKLNTKHNLDWQLLHQWKSQLKEEIIKNDTYTLETFYFNLKQINILIH